MPSVTPVCLPCHLVCFCLESFHAFKNMMAVIKLFSQFYTQLCLRDPHRPCPDALGTPAVLAGIVRCVDAPSTHAAPCGASVVGMTV